MDTDSYQLLRNAIENQAKANLELGISLGALLNKDGKVAKEIVESFAKGNLSAATNHILSASPAISHMEANSEAPAAGPAAKPTKKRVETEGQKEPSSKRTKSVVKPKKPKLYIADKTKLPEIDLEELEAKWEEILEATKDGLSIDYSEEKDETRKLILNCPAIQTALKLLNGNLAFLAPTTRTKWEKAAQHKTDTARTYRICCVISLIVAIERKRVWDTIPYDPEDFVVTDADIPSDMPKVAPKEEIESGSKKKIRSTAISSKDDTRVKIRTSKQNSLDIYKKIVGQDTGSSELLGHYAFQNVGRILCYKWNAPTRPSNSAQQSDFKKPSTCKVVSEKTKKFLECLLTAEEWQREMECLYYSYQEGVKKIASTTAPSPAPAAPASEQ